MAPSYLTLKERKRRVCAFLLPHSLLPFLGTAKRRKIVKSSVCHIGVMVALTGGGLATYRFPWGGHGEEFKGKLRNSKEIDGIP